MIGSIEPHKVLLSQPEEDKLLYKIIGWENFYNSVVGSYLYFNRVDSYRDFEDADQFDGEQLPLNREFNEKISFVKNPNFSLSNYYDQSRARTYACCFSLEHTDYMWEKYGNEGKNSLYLVFNFGKLKQTLNKTLEKFLIQEVTEEKALNYLSIFSINYGNIEYIRRKDYRSKDVNPIKDTYRKDVKYEQEKEFRISLSALGIGKYRWNGQYQFSTAIQYPFDFQNAFEEKVIESISVCNDRDPSIRKKLEGLGIRELV